MTIDSEKFLMKFRVSLRISVSFFCLVDDGNVSCEALDMAALAIEPGTACRR